MRHAQPLILIKDPAWGKKIQALFEKMDQAYETSASASGFTCRGCTDNCCYSLFYHHTLLELFYLKEGLKSLPQETLNKVIFRAQEVTPQLHKKADSGSSEKIPCPLMDEGRCLAYTHRPMVCRLHGVAHILERPDGKMMESPGCPVYEESGKAALPLNRTPLYQEMAAIERALRQETGFSDRLKLTIAEMILL